MTHANDFTSTPEAIEQERLLSMCAELDIPPLSLQKYKINPELLQLIPEGIARVYKVMPIARFKDLLTLATSDPFDIVALENLKSIIKIDIQPVLSTSFDIMRAINEAYSAADMAKTMAGQKGSGASEAQAQLAVGEESLDIEEIAELSQKSQIVELVNKILMDASKRRASDIHIEAYLDVVRVRFRIDGMMLDAGFTIQKKEYAAIIARLKIISKLDITQRRLPQDGRISMHLESREIDLRVSILPLVTGEKVVMRILEKGDAKLDMQKLGFSQYAVELFEKAISKPHGMILITGPTGSGKSTSLYMLMSRLNNSEKHLITIEDPVEYHMNAITQIQAKTEIGLTFASVLRAVLRQTPDVVMVGEIRDFETVDIAIKAALTGHLILSTLHTNDAPSAIVRLLNMKVEPFLISSTLTLVAAQRLCRKICQECKEPYELSIANLAGLPADLGKTKKTFFRGKGCPHCNNTGYFGRVAVVEALLLDEGIRQLILERATLTKLREHARQLGMRTLREDAIDKCLKGEISLEEVMRVAPEE